MHVKRDCDCFSSIVLLPLISLLLLQAIIALAYDLGTDKQALLDFANTLHNAPRGRLGWTSTEPAVPDSICTSWVGVTCTPGRSRVVELRLPDFGLRGTLSGDTTIGGLDALEKLDLSNNSLSGVIPPNLNFLRLKHLNLSSNRFSGTIPVSLRGFPPTSFGGNSLLCGPPLTHHCGGLDLHLVETHHFISPLAGSLGRRSLVISAARKGKRGRISKRARLAIIICLSSSLGLGALAVIIWCYCCFFANKK